MSKLELEVRNKKQKHTRKKNWGVFCLNINIKKYLCGKTKMRRYLDKKT